MTLLALLNLPDFLLLLPNNGPTLSDYLTDWHYHLRTNMPYDQDEYQRLVNKYIVGEAVFFYLFLMAGLRRIPFAHFYLLFKLLTFAILFYTPSSTTAHYIAWILCHIAYPAELFIAALVIFWAIHRYAIPEYRKFGGMRIWDTADIVVKRKGRPDRIKKDVRFVARIGTIFNYERLIYQACFTLLYAYGKYMLLLGNPLANPAQKDLWDDLDNLYYIQGPRFEHEFGFMTSFSTPWSRWMHALTQRKYPLTWEGQKQDAYFYKEVIFGGKVPMEVDRERREYDLLYPLIKLFGVKLPWMMRRDRAEAEILPRWTVKDTRPYTWVGDKAKPFLDAHRTEFRKAVEKYLASRSEKRALAFIRRNLYRKVEPTIKVTTEAPLGQRVIDNLTTNQFTADRERILTPDHKLYRKLTSTAKEPGIVQLTLPRYRFRTYQFMAFRGTTPLNETEKLTRYPIVKVRNAPDLMATKPALTYTDEYWFRPFRSRQKNVHWLKRKTNGGDISYYTLEERPGVVYNRKIYTAPTETGLPTEQRNRPIAYWNKIDFWEYKENPVWRKKYEEAAPTTRTGFTGFNFEQFAPLMELDSISNLRYGLLFILALSSLTVYSIILAGWSSNSKYAFLGALRSAAQMISYEVSISLALLPVILLSGSLNLTAIVYGQIGTVWYLFPLLPIALVFLVSMLAETNRTPFDLPEAEAELVAGYNVDYSSLPFAMFFLGEYSNMILISVLFCLLFLGGWDGAVVTLQEPYVLTLKAAVVWIFFVIVRATLPRYRYDQLMDIGWKAFLPFAGSFLVFVIGLVVFLDVAPVVEEVALEDLYGVPSVPTAENSHNSLAVPLVHPQLSTTIATAPPKVPHLTPTRLISTSPISTMNLFNYNLRPTNSRSNPLSTTLSNHLLSYPTPSNLTYNWSFGSLAGLFFALQLVTGIFLAMHYTPHVEWAFQSVEHIMTDVTGGYLFRYFHANGASAIFILIYAHMARGLYYQSYLTRATLWTTGVLIFLLMMATAFIGYVLPWGQMSFWGATVITSLVTAVPLVGEDIAYWVWGGFSIGNATLTRFFSLHFVLPFLILGIILFLHLMVLHTDGSTEPFVLPLTPSKVPFHPYYTLKDTFIFYLCLALFGLLVFYVPNMLGHSDNFLPANPLVTPAHIVPEWYFTPFYAILRACPHKIGGALGMFAAILVLAFLANIIKAVDALVVSFAVFATAHKLAFWVFAANFLNLMYLGSSPAAAPYVISSKVSTGIYFGYFLVVLPLLAFLGKEVLMEVEKEEEKEEDAALPAENSFQTKTVTAAKVTAFTPFRPLSALSSFTAGGSTARTIQIHFPVHNPNTRVLLTTKSKRKGIKPRSKAYRLCKPLRFLHRNELNSLSARLRGEPRPLRRRHEPRPLPLRRELWYLLPRYGKYRSVQTGDRTYLKTSRHAHSAYTEVRAELYTPALYYTLAPLLFIPFDLSTPGSKWIAIGAGVIAAAGLGLFFFTPLGAAAAAGSAATALTTTTAASTAVTATGAAATAITASTAASSAVTAAAASGAAATALTTSTAVTAAAAAAPLYLSASAIPASIPAASVATYLATAQAATAFGATPALITGSAAVSSAAGTATAILSAVPSALSPVSVAAYLTGAAAATHLAVGTSAAPNTAPAAESPAHLPDDPWEDNYERLARNSELWEKNYDMLRKNHDIVVQCLDLREKNRQLMRVENTELVVRNGALNERNNELIAKNEELLCQLTARFKKNVARMTENSKNIRDPSEVDAIADLLDPTGVPPQEVLEALLPLRKRLIINIDLVNATTRAGDLELPAPADYAEMWYTHNLWENYHNYLEGTYSWRLAAGLDALTSRHIHDVGSQPFTETAVMLYQQYFMQGYVVRGSRTLANEFTDSILNNADVFTSLNPTVGQFLRPDTLTQVSTVLNAPPRGLDFNWSESIEAAGRLTPPGFYSFLAFATLLTLARYLTSLRR